MATVDELRTFLSKRGFDASVVKKVDTWLIGVHSKSIEDVVAVLASVNEPGRFIVSVVLDDIIPVLDEALQLPILRNKFNNLEESMGRNKESLVRTDEANKRQAEESILSLTDKLDVLSQKVQDLGDDIYRTKQQPWWKRFLGVK